MMLFICILFSLFLLYYYIKDSNFMGVVLFLIVLFMGFEFDLFIDSYNLSLLFCMDQYSFSLVMLSLWILSMVFFSLEDLSDLSLCNGILLGLMVILFMLFFSMNLLFFYFMFEASLLMVFLIIVKWGLGGMRMLAGYYLMFYTLFFSLPLLMFFFYLFNFTFTSDMFLMGDYMCYINFWVYLYTMSSFFVKIPLYLMHGWLLKAHVEAPVFGSMILASILLKLGGYGLLRLNLIFYDNLVQSSFYFVSISMVGSMFLSLVCLRQVDMKLLVAYSSVVHMGVMVCGMYTLVGMGTSGMFITMIGHGFCSSGLFYLVNLCYKETNSRLMFVNKGMMTFFPSLSLIWFMFCSSNMSAPVSLNLVSELFLFTGLVSWLYYLYIYVVFICFFGFVYSLYLYCYVQHGKANYYLKVGYITYMDFIVLLMHWLPLNLLFINMNYL